MGEGWPPYFDTAHRPGIVLDASFSLTQTCKHATDEKDPSNAMPIDTSSVQGSEATFT